MRKSDTTQILKTVMNIQGIIGKGIASRLK